MNLEVLISAVNQEAAELIPQMHICTDAVLVNQCDRYAYELIAAGRGKVKCFSMPERGVGLSRNTALLHASGDVVLFSDEDIVLAADYKEQITKAYQKLPDADMILFNVQACPPEGPIGTRKSAGLAFAITGDTRLTVFRQS